MVKIRLARAGAKKQPFYHIVVTDSRSPRDGKFIQRLGFFDPKASGSAPRLELDAEKLNSWQRRGAQLSERVARLVREQQWGAERVEQMRARNQEQKRARAQKKAAEAEAS